MNLLQLIVKLYVILYTCYIYLSICIIERFVRGISKNDPESVLC